MRIAVGADHAGFALKCELVGALVAEGLQVDDLGPKTAEPVDYPDVATAVAEAVRQGHTERGLLICGSGAGVSIAANKFPGIRAAVCHDTYTARQAVEHDDMNVLCLGARVIGGAVAYELVHTFLDARFSGEARHQRRVSKVVAIESQQLGRAPTLS